ncbi:tripeptidyl-peptidase sed4 [Fusarium oxysporum f. sp. phaseoli]
MAQVSDLYSNQCGQYLGAHELRAILPDKDLITKRVMGWPRDEGLSNYIATPDHVDVTTAISDWNQVLNTPFHQFQHRVTGRIFIRTSQYSIPSTQKDMRDQLYISHADGGSLPVEAELDLDYAMAFTGPLLITFYSVGAHAPKIGQASNGPISPEDHELYAEFFEYVLGMKDPPKVISTSYNDVEQDATAAYATHVCNLPAKAAARGIFIIGSSGDGGAAGTD